MTVRLGDESGRRTVDVRLAPLAPVGSYRLVSATQYFKQLARKLTADPSEFDDEEIREEARALGADRLDKCTPGDVVTLVGELRSVSTCPKGSNIGVHAEFFDGTDAVSLVWLGRAQIPGLEVGRSISVRGRLGLKEGRNVMYNPYYELLEES